MNKAVARLLTAETVKRFLLARMEWLIRGWFFAAGMWTMVGIAWLMAKSPELAASLLDRLH